MSQSPLAKRLKEARLACGLSQRKLGLLALIDESTASVRMNQYETGKHEPDFNTLTHIAAVLHLPVAFFYAEEDSLAHWIRLFSTLDPSRLRLFYTWLALQEQSTVE